ncbi:MAG: GTPase RsgA, partial [Candidatus Zixiibacteriota bacterium]
IKTCAVRESDGRGRHTTTAREMIILPDGGIVIDTPGMREIQMWGDAAALKKTFGDIEELITQCRFGDCQHQMEPGCAIQRALRNETLDYQRYRSYLRLQREHRHLTLRQDEKERRRAEREFDRKIRRHNKAMKDLRKKGLI